MARTDRYARLSKISLERHDIAIDLDWRYPQLFDWLQVSPSYRLAHLIATGRLAGEGQTLPADFADVERTYAAFGDVQRTYFGEWWFNTAQFRFGVSATPKPQTFLRLDHRQASEMAMVQQARVGLERYLAAERPAEGLPAALVIAIPVSRDRRRVLREVAALIDREFGPEHQEQGVISAKLIDNKMRERTLVMAMRVLLARINAPKAKLYQVGNNTKIAPHYWTDETRRRSDDQDGKRRMMEIVTARQLKRAYLIAENAARGRFPSLDPLPADPGRPEFDYPILRKQLWDYVMWGRKRVEGLKAQKASERKAKAANSGAALQTGPASVVSKVS